MGLSPSGTFELCLQSKKDTKEREVGAMDTVFCVGSLYNVHTFHVSMKL